MIDRLLKLKIPANGIQFTKTAPYARTCLNVVIAHMAHIAMALSS